VWFPLPPAEVRQGAEVSRIPEERATLVFARDHWTWTGQEDPTAGWSYRCSFFDPASRLCTAHEHRPPVCRGYPWFGAEPRRGLPLLPQRCSHWADLGEPTGTGEGSGGDEYGQALHVLGHREAVESP
jgi:Fe-S-cluster containining protein